MDWNFICMRAYVVASSWPIVTRKLWCWIGWPRCIIDRWWLDPESGCRIALRIDGRLILGNCDRDSTATHLSIHFLTMMLKRSWSSRIWLATNEAQEFRFIDPLGVSEALCEGIAVLSGFYQCGTPNLTWLPLARIVWNSKHLIINNSYNFAVKILKISK